MRFGERICSSGLVERAMWTIALLGSLEARGVPNYDMLLL